jgi:hypothetical protein
MAGRVRETALVWLLRRWQPTVPGEVAMAANIAMAAWWDRQQARPRGRSWWIDPLWTWVQGWRVASPVSRA